MNLDIHKMNITEIMELGNILVPQKINETNMIKKDLIINVDLWIAKAISGPELIKRLIKYSPFGIKNESKLRQNLHFAMFHYELGDTSYKELVDYLYEITHTDYFSQELEAKKHQK